MGLILQMVLCQTSTSNIYSIGINYVGLIADDIDKQVLGLVAFVFFFVKFIGIFCIDHHVVCN